MFDISSGKMLIATDELSARQCLKNVLLTSFGELMGDYEFGCQLKSMIFELQSDLVRNLLAEIIATTAEKFVPQLTVNPAEVNITQNQNTVRIVINYSMNTTGKTNWLTLESTPDGSFITI